MNGEPHIVTGLNVAVNALFSDYVFSTFLSSPLTVETLYKESKDKVFKYLTLASLASIGFSIVTSALFANIWGLITALVMVAIIDAVYLNALR